MTLDPQTVLAAAHEWVWVPHDAEQRRTDEYWLIAYPPHFAEPTMAFHLGTERGPEALVADVLDAARELGRDAVTFADVDETTRPPELEPYLRERGAELVETLAVLALDLGRGLPDLDPPDDVELRRVLDLPTRRDLDRVETTVFGGRALDDEQLAASVAAIAAEVDTPRWVAYRDGAAVGAAGLTLAGDVVRLWGGGVLPEARHTGVYRALLDHRLREGLDRGARMALVRGRVETSAPVLLRAGFGRFGEQRSWRLRA